MVALAGCAKGEKTDAPVLTETILEDAGIIEGTVVDDSLALIPNAQVAVLDQGVQSTTDEAGFFRLTNLAPGDYQIAAAALGFSSAAKAVSVVAGEATAVQFVLAPIAIVEEYAEVLGPLAGYFGCRVGTPASRGPCLPHATVNGAVFSNEASSFDLPFANETAAYVGEMRWSQGSFATSQQLVLSFSYQGRSSFHWFCSNTSASPLQWVYLMDGGCQVERGDAAQDGNDGEPEEPNSEIELISYANSPFGSTQSPFHVATEQRFEVVYTIFYGAEPVLPYSAFPDT